MKTRSFAADVREQRLKRDWRRNVLSLADAGLPWVPIFGQNVYLHNLRNIRPVPHVHEGCVEIVYCKKGVCRYEVGGRSVLLKAGMALVTQPGQSHRRIGSWQSFTTNYLLLRLPASGRGLRGLTTAEAGYVISRLTSCPSVLQCGRGFATRFQGVLSLASAPKSPKRDIRIKCGLLDLILSLDEAEQPKSVRSALANDVRVLAHDMNRDPGRAWSVEELATRLGVSIPVINQQFREETGFTPHAYLMRCRIAQAKRLLSQDSLSLTLIASRLGFSSLQHFIGAFRNAVGVSPGVWRTSRGVKKLHLKNL